MQASYFRLPQTNQITFILAVRFIILIVREKVSRGRIGVLPQELLSVQEDIFLFQTFLHFIPAAFINIRQKLLKLCLAVPWQLPLMPAVIILPMFMEDYGTG